MGITQHTTGVDNVRAIVNLALARGNVGRAGRGPDADPRPLRRAGRRGDGLLRDGVSRAASPINEAQRGRAFARSGASRCRRRVGSTRRRWSRPRAAATSRCCGRAAATSSTSLPAPDITRTALARTPLRVHQDIVLTHQMLVEPGETVVLLPAATRYEQDGRRHVDHDGAARRVQPRDRRARGSARRGSEYRDLPRRRPARRIPSARLLLGCDDRAGDPRGDRARRAGVRRASKTLRDTGDAIQVGGARLCEGGVFPTADGRARFSVVVPADAEVPPGHFLLSTRRGKQFNSMVWSDVDPAHRRRRATRCCSPRPTPARSASPTGDALLVRSPHGEMRARAHVAPIRAGNVQAFFPEANVLLAPNRRDPISGVPDYNAVVEVVPIA